MPFAPLLVVLQPALVTDKDWACYKIDIKRDLVHRVFVLHKNWAHLNWMERSQHIAWRRMRVTPYSLILGLALFIMAGWAGFSCSQRNGGIRSSKRVQLHLVRLPLLSFFSIYAADTGPNKNHQGGREWGLIVFCRYRGQYQQHALWSPHRDSICWVKSVRFLPTSWLEDVGLHCGLKKSSSTLCLASQQNKHPNPEIILSLGLMKL